MRPEEDRMEHRKGTLSLKLRKEFATGLLLKQSLSRMMTVRRHARLQLATVVILYEVFAF